jgi:hypothetical protein
MFRPIRFAVLLAGVTLAFAALAQEGDQADPPSRVARLSFIHGDVSFVPAGENDWVQAQLNRPLVTGDKLFADGGSRASLEIGAASIRMDQNSNFDFLNLDDNNAQMELTQGALNLRVRRLYDGQNYEIDTPTLAFVVNRVGEFRVNVQDNGQGTTVTVLSGGGDVYGEGGARFRVEEGQSVTFNDSQLQDYYVNDLPRPDAFDDFCHQRDQRMNASTSRRYVSEEVIGYEDLDEYGNWDDAPEYGHVWYPTSIAVGWSPYHNGHWGWVGAYGWSWVDDAPWGFAPFHYGRWVSVRGRWGWCPGRIDVRPVYAPALVAFVGGGVNVSVGFGGGGPIGWFPLGWGEPYIPSYHVSRNYFTQVNVSNTVINNTVINNYYGSYSAGNVNYNQITYANRNVAGGITAVPAAAFVSAKPVAASAVAVNRETFANARVAGFAPVAPTRASLAPQVAARAVPPAAVVNRPIVAATKPPAPVASFAAREAVLAKDPGKPLPQHQLRTTGVVAGASAGGAAAVAARPNMKLVTQGAPVRATEAPKLPVKTGAAPAGGAAAMRANPAATPNAAINRPAAQAGNEAVTGNGNARNAQQLNSSRFAHPGAGNETKAVGNAVNTPAPRVVPSEQKPMGNREAGNAKPNQDAAATTINRPQYNQGAPRSEYHPPAQAQEYRKPAQAQAQEYNKPAPQTNRTQEYRKPAQVQTQDYNRAPVQTQHQAPVQAQPQYHPQQQVQQMPATRAPQPAAQQAPRYAPPPQQQQQSQPARGQERKKDKDKDKDDDKHGGR